MKKYSWMLASTALVAISNVFDPAKNGWKTNAEGQIEMKDGNPVYVDSSGTERTMDANRIAQLNGEAQGFRTRAETAEASLKAFEGIDATKAKEALDVVSKLDQKQLIDAGEVDKVRSEIEGAFKTQLSDAQTALETANKKIDGMRLDGAFNGSKFVAERVNAPVDMVRSTFGNNFRVENDSLVPYDGNGNKIYSAERPGEIAGFDEALSILISGRADKDSLLLTKPRSGSGNEGGGGGNGQGKTLTRAEFAALSPAEQANFSAEARQGKAQIVSG